METTLTLPKNRIGASLEVAGMGSLALAGTPHDALTTLLDNGIRSTGSNVAWLESALPGSDPAQAEDLYVLSIVRLTSVTTKAQEATVARSDRDSILEIKDVLSLTGIQLAKAMKVSRTALYQWIDESKTMRPKSRERLERLRSVSVYWYERVGLPISRCPWVGGTQRARLVEMLASNDGCRLDGARVLLEELAVSKPKPEPMPAHRSILEIAKERNWKKLPEHVRQAQWDSRRPSARTTPDPS